MVTRPMSAARLIPFLSLLLLSLMGRASIEAQVTVEGLDDEEVYADIVTFEIPAEDGFTYVATLNGANVAVGESVDVFVPGYYELFVERTETATQIATVTTVQFIVRASARGNSEWGLRPWEPLPNIASDASEFEGASLQLVAPSSVPAGVSFPVVARVLNAEARRVGVFGRVELGEDFAVGIDLLRGIGSTVLRAGASDSSLLLDGRVAGLAASHRVDVEADTQWTEVSGTLEGVTDWGESARVRVVDDLSVPAGAQLRIGAGSVMQIGEGVGFHIGGSLVVEGSEASPTLWTPIASGAPWGGLQFRGEGATATFAWTLFTGSGADPDWFDNTPDSGSAHRDEEPLLWVGEGTTVTLDDCALVDLQGQAGHGDGGDLTMNRCLVQRVVTAGQYNRGSVRFDGCALIEFPADGADFLDDDNDGLYLTGGAHEIVDTLVGWALDDGIDAGSGAAGSVLIDACWIESCYHEALAWSEERDATVRASVFINCGQGVECGFDNPAVDVEGSLSTANLVGYRFGDNYDWDYDGFLTVTSSLGLYNDRDVWGFNWDDWTYRVNQMDIRDNHFSQENRRHPSNTLWDPARDAALLAPFLPTPATMVGVGLALRGERLTVERVRQGLAVRTSSFALHEVRVDWVASNAVGPLDSGVLVFQPGETVRSIGLGDLADAAFEGLVVEISNPLGARLTGVTRAYLPAEETLVPWGASWSYLARSAAPDAGWQTPQFDDGAWPEGAAELGAGDGDETTEIDIGPDDDRYPTVYFRHEFELEAVDTVEALRVGIVRDDAAVIWLNGVEVWRDNLPTGVIAHETLALDTQNGSEEDIVVQVDLPPDALLVGPNLIAVEVHQAALDSSDLSFDLSLTALMRPVAEEGVRFRRGDQNADGNRDISDAVQILLLLFGGGTTTCFSAADVDDSGQVDITDGIALLDYLFRGGDVPQQPFPTCGLDPTPEDTDCQRYDGC